jgi:hypothetical protein
VFFSAPLFTPRLRVNFLLAQRRTPMPDRARA